MRFPRSIAALCVVLASGCASKHQPTLFPAEWPGAAVSSAKASPASASGPTVLVQPLVVEEMRQSGHDVSSNTEKQLTNLLIAELKAKGIRAVDSESLVGSPDYVLTGFVPTLVYRQLGGYPRKVLYGAQLSAQLTDKNRKVLLMQNTERDFERLVMVNTMTKLPGQEAEHNQFLMEKCVIPAWQSVASEVKFSVLGKEE